MKICILEVCSLNHVCMIENWVSIANKNNWEITVFTTQEFIEQISNKILNYSKLELVVRKNESIKKFFNLIEKKTKNFDYMIITSLQAYFIEFLFFKPECKVHLCIHNSNTWFVKSNINNIKSLIKQFVRYIWKKKVDAFVLNSNNMLEYLAKNTKITKKIYVLPFSMKQKEIIVSKDSKRLQIIYPGIVCTKRKSYNIFLEFAQKYKEHDFILLGKINYEEGGLELVEKIEKMNLTNIKYFNEYLNQKRFDDYMKKADMLFSYVNIDYNNAGYLEYYGRSKDSGVSYLMLEYCLPLLINSDFENFDDLNKYTFFYNDINSLISLFDSLNKNKRTSDKMRNEILKIRKKYSAENYALILKEILIER